MVTFIPTTRSRPRLGLVFDAAISRYKEKHAFLCVFKRLAAEANYKNGAAIFVNTEGRRFAAMFEQAELRGIPMGPNGPPNAKETA